MNDADRKLKQTRMAAYDSMGLNVKEAMNVHSDWCDHIRMIAINAGVTSWDLAVRTADDGSAVASFTWGGKDHILVVPRMTNQTHQDIYRVFERIVSPEIYVTASGRKVNADKLASPYALARAGLTQPTIMPVQQPQAAKDPIDLVLSARLAESDVQASFVIDKHAILSTVIHAGGVKDFWCDTIRTPTHMSGLVIPFLWMGVKRKGGEIEHAWVSLVLREEELRLQVKNPISFDILVREKLKRVNDEAKALNLPPNQIGPDGRTRL